MRANYNARPCDGERKAAVPRTMASNGKNNAQNNGNSRKSGRVLTHRLVISTSYRHPQKQSPAAERRRAQTSETRINAIAHPSAERTLKSAPAIPAELSKKPAICRRGWHGARAPSPPEGGEGARPPCWPHMRSSRLYSGRIFAPLITRPHLSSSALRNAASSAGGRPLMTTPPASSFCFTVGSASALTVSE
jgi:hypothetical protein